MFKTLHRWKNSYLFRNVHLASSKTRIELLRCRPSSMFFGLESLLRLEQNIILYTVWIQCYIIAPPDHPAVSWLSSDLGKTNKHTTHNWWVFSLYNFFRSSQDRLRSITNHSKSAEPKQVPWTLKLKCRAARVLWVMGNSWNANAAWIISERSCPTTSSKISHTEGFAKWFPLMPL